jgi:biopolymer transport protein ExbD
VIHCITEKNLWKKISQNSPFKNNRMPRIKVPKKSPSLDMTPMVDLAFLLVTFFMLTTKFRPDEPVIVDMPSSVSEIPLPDKNVFMITVDKDGRVFYNVEGQQIRTTILEKMADRYQVKFTPQEEKGGSTPARIE